MSYVVNSLYFKIISDHIEVPQSCNLNHPKVIKFHQRRYWLYTYQRRYWILIIYISSTYQVERLTVDSGELIKKGKAPSEFLLHPDFASHLYRRSI